MVKEWNFLHAVNIIGWEICNYYLTKVKKKNKKKKKKNQDKKS